MYKYFYKNSFQNNVCAQHKSSISVGTNTKKNQPPNNVTKMVFRSKPEKHDKSITRKVIKNERFSTTSFYCFLLCALLWLPTESLISASPTGTEHHTATSSGFDLSSILVHHLMDTVIFEWNIGGVKVYEDDQRFVDQPFLRRYAFRDKSGRLYKYAGGIPMHLTRRVVQMMLVAALLVFVCIMAARRISRSPYRIADRFSNLLESLFQWCRKEVVDPSMHGHAKGFYSYIVSLFLFILFLNLAGLLPPIGEGLEKLWHAISQNETTHGASHTESAIIAIWPGITVTGDLSVTFALAMLTVLMIWITGFRYQGIHYFWQVVPNGVPTPLYVLLWPLEFIVGPLAKGFALTIRLLANMTAGHVIILALLGFIFQAAKLWAGGPMGIAGAASITLASLTGTVAIYLLEILVSFLQAFIFTLLTALFIGSSMHRH